MSEIITQNGTQVQAQIDDVNRKLDLILEELAIQRQKRQALEDLATDLKLIGNDLFRASVNELDNAGVEVDGEQLKSLLFRFLRNAEMLNEMMLMAEGAMDLIKDAGPIVTQMGLDGIKKMNDLETKGYFDFAKEVAKIMDNIVTHFSKEDVKLLADNIVTILETVKSLTQPEMLHAMNNAVNVYKNLDVENVEDYTLWRAFKELKTPEMRKGIGFVMSFLRNIAVETNNNKTNINN